MKYPMKLQAPLKDYLWGGTRLKDEYGKAAQTAKVAESWSLPVTGTAKASLQTVRHRGRRLPIGLRQRGGMHSAHGRRSFHISLSSSS